MRRESLDLAGEAAKDARALIPRDTPRADMGLSFDPSEDELMDRLTKREDAVWAEAANRHTPPTYHKAGSNRLGGKPSTY